MGSIEKQVTPQMGIHNKKVLLLLIVCILLSAVIAGIGGFLVGKTSIQPAQPPVAKQTISRITSQISPSPAVAPALSMFGFDFPSDKFTCHGFSWRYDCFLPWDTKSTFQFNDNDKLSCQGITLEHLINNSGSKFDGPAL